MVMLALILGLLLVRVSHCRGGDEAALAQGSVHLLQALRGDEAAWGAAEEAFVHASRGRLFDAYPYFALTLTRHLRERDVETLEEALRPVAEALLAADLEGARAALDGARSAMGYRWMARLLEALEGAAGDR